MDLLLLWLGLPQEEETGPRYRQRPAATLKIAAAENLLAMETDAQTPAALAAAEIVVPAFHRLALVLPFLSEVLEVLEEGNPSDPVYLENGTDALRNGLATELWMRFVIHCSEKMIVIL